MAHQRKRASGRTDPLAAVTAANKFVGSLSCSDIRIQRALELFQQDHIPDCGMAVLFNLSASRFRHLFKSEVGTSPTHYMKLIRLKRAKSLLQNSFLQIKEIAALVGVNDVSHFVRDYKSIYGETPSHTRLVVRQDSLRHDRATSQDRQ